MDVTENSNKDDIKHRMGHCKMDNEDDEERLTEPKILDVGCNGEGKM